MIRYECRSIRKSREEAGMRKEVLLDAINTDPPGPGTTSAVGQVRCHVWEGSDLYDYFEVGNVYSLSFEDLGARAEE